MARLIASWFGTGLILGKVRGSDIGSGTLASVVAYPLAVGIGEFGGILAQIASTVVVTGLAYWSIASLVDGEGDAGWLVVDEASGVFLATIGLSWWPALIALIVFRAADILKRWFPGVARAEQIPGAGGVIADDLVAGIYGLVAGLIASAAL